MAEDDLEELEEEGGRRGGGDEDEFERHDDGSGKKKLFIIIGVALLLVVGGIAAAYFTGVLQPVLDMMGGGEEVATETLPEEAMLGTTFVPYPLDEMLVNLTTSGRKSQFLKIKVTLELQNATDVPAVEMKKDRITDSFQVYLRELRVEDLKGSAGMYRLREELLARVNAAVAPVKVNDVLFNEMLVQ